MEKCQLCGQEIQPKASLDDIRKVVMVFKIVSGFKKEDKAWDKMFFGRYTKPAKELIAFLGNWKDAGDCVQDIYERMKEIGRDVTFETIIKHCAEWKKNKQEKEGTGGVLSSQSVQRQSS